MKYVLSGFITLGLVFGLQAMEQGSNNIYDDFYNAIRTRDCKRVEALLTLNPQLANAQFPQGSVLHSVLLFNSDLGTKIAKLLIHAGADVKAVDKERKTAFERAVEINNYEIQYLLLKSFAMPRQDKVLPQLLVLCSDATDSIFVRVFAPLIDQQQDYQDFLGNTALMYAAAHGEVALVEFLLEQGANPLIKNDFGDTVLDILNLLLKFKAHKKRKNYERIRALCCAVTQEMLQESMKEEPGYLNRLPKDILKRTEAYVFGGKKNVSDHAVEEDEDKKHLGDLLCRVTLYSKSYAFAKMLIDMGAPVDHKLELGGVDHTPLLSAIDRKCDAIVKLLVDAGANVNSIDSRASIGPRLPPTDDAVSSPSSWKIPTLMALGVAGLVYWYTLEQANQEESRIKPVVAQA